MREELDCLIIGASSIVEDLVLIDSNGVFRLRTEFSELKNCCFGDFLILMCKGIGNF